MVQKLVLFSGALAVGKSTVANVLIAEHGFESIRSGAYLRSLANGRSIDINRTNLQQLGDSLDAETDFLWIVENVAVPLLDAKPQQTLWLLDSVRKKRQVEHFRARFGDDVHHIHFVADEVTLRQRYEARIAQGGAYEGGVPYDAAVIHPNEISSRSLIELADVVIDLSAIQGPDAASQIWKLIGAIPDA